MVRYLKELVIDIANDPAFSNRSIEFECDLPEITASIDPDLFHRAVCNLVVNALVHNPPHTTVTVSVIEDKEKGICLSVRDNGVGISETEQAKLFTRYYRGTNTKEKSEGSGLGLAIAKQIVVSITEKLLSKASRAREQCSLLSSPQIKGKLRYIKVRPKMGDL